MLSNKTIGLLAAAAAAYGVYKYTKMTPEQKKDLMAKGKDFLNKNLGSLKDTMGQTRTQGAESGF